MFFRTVRSLTLVAVLAVALPLALPAVSGAAPLSAASGRPSAAMDAGWWREAWQWLANLLPGSPAARSGGLASSHDADTDRGILIDPNGQPGHR